uniref:Uncharacterized protein n=1 Tax=Ditylenchus dipsaci TaxID=166011 RepID=A0A915EHZ0_9BILA
MTALNIVFASQLKRFSRCSLFQAFSIRIVGSDNRHLYEFISKHFPTFPFNTIDIVNIKQSDSHEPQFSKQHDMYNDTLSTSCSLQELQQYSSSGKWMVKSVHLDQFRPEWLSAKWKSALESINPLWQGSILRMRNH